MPFDVFAVTCAVQRSKNFQTFQTHLLPLRSAYKSTLKMKALDSSEMSILSVLHNVKIQKIILPTSER